jgi:antirestriction protein ArdC
VRTSDLYERITRHIVNAIEAGADDFVMPWQNWGASTGSPVNAISGRSYRGINTLLLWAAAELDGHSSGRWATYRQWSSAGAQVRKGEKATAILFWKSAANDGRGRHDEDERTTGPRFIARSFFVFNASQVDGADQSLPTAMLTKDERVGAAETFFNAAGANLEHGGDRAFYRPNQDKICMPKFEQFKDPPSYYSVLGHEHVHWTGAKRRLDRDLEGRFGTDSYAMEELVAELGSAFLAARLGISVEPRPDHASYIASWLRVLRNDARAVLTASSKAQEAVDYLSALAEPKGGQGAHVQTEELIIEPIAA